MNEVESKKSKKARTTTKRCLSTMATVTEVEGQGG
jgi:hypothetical protein